MVVVTTNERGGSHELARLTVAALRNVLGNPGFLYRVQRTVLRAEAFDSRDLLGPDRRDGQRTRARRCAVEMDGAGTAEARAATVLRAGEVEIIAQYPEERRIRGGIDSSSSAVDEEGERRHGSP